MKQLHDGKWYNTELAEEIAESRFAKNCKVALALTEPPIMPSIYCTQSCSLFAEFSSTPSA